MFSPQNSSVLLDSLKNNNRSMHKILHGNVTFELSYGKKEKGKQKKNMAQIIILLVDGPTNSGGTNS